MTKSEQHTKLVAILKALPGAKNCLPAILNDAASNVVGLNENSLEYEISSDDVDNLESAADGIFNAHRYLGHLSVGAKQDVGADADMFEKLAKLESKLRKAASENKKDAHGQEKEHEKGIAAMWLETVKSITGQEPKPQIADAPFTEVMKIFGLKGSAVNLLATARKRALAMAS